MVKPGREVYSSEELRRKEAAFFDSMADSEDLSIQRKHLERDTPFAHVTPAGNRHIHDFLGPLEGKRALDVGCGTGINTILLAKKGCRVTSIDVSERLLEVARQSVRKYGVEGQIDTIRRMGAEALDFPDGSFDIVYGGDVLHHTKIERTVPEIARVMRSGARGVFVETLATNPLFVFVRQHVTGHFGIQRCRTETEFPLRIHELNFIAGHFQSFEMRGDVMLSMMREYLFKGRGIGSLLEAVDGFMFGTFPALRRLAYHGILTVRK